ncbi:MAG: TonB-dependent receptor [Sphingobacteriaceae bacterium]|nr:TonB-dependent receptor [Sphingobacteriaceae bacterium]
MKVSTIILFLFLALKSDAKNIALIISGRVTDITTNEALPGATIAIPELQISINTNQNGEFTLTRVPTRGRFLVEVRYIGYKTITRLVDFSTAEPIHFALQQSVIEVHEVVITGTVSSSENHKNSTSVSTVSRDELTGRASQNIIDAISHVPGVSQVSTGAAISKPVIRGLGANRVITLSNGVKQEGQQWGDEHGIEVDQYSAERVEILRGAASLLYGSDALGGVINIITAVPPPPGQIRGELLSNYAANNGLTGTSAMLQGNSGGFVWQGRGTYKNAFAYNTADGRIPNTGFKETNLSGMIGLNKPWGYTHLNLSSFNQKLGLPDFERNDKGQFEDEEGNVFSPSLLKSRDLLLPFQDVRHYKIALNNHLLFNKGRLRSTLGFQNNQRRELEESISAPSLFFDLKTYSYDLKYYFEDSNGWQPVFGIAGAFQNSKNKAEELLIPDYDSNDFGAFAYLKKSWENTTVNAGLRYDYRNISGIEMEEEGVSKFQNFTNRFSNLSGALGFTQDFNEMWNFKANLGSAFRAPNISELSSEGVHEGTRRYEIGNTGLKPERSIYADMALEFHNKRIDFHLNVHNNYINKYIYARRVNNEDIEVDGEDEALPLYRYVQDDANLYGFEAGVTLHPVSLFHFENSFSLVRGNNSATKNSLPFMPAPVLRNELRIEPEINSASFKNFYFSIELENVFKQSKIDKEFETSTSAYTLVNSSIGTTINVKNQPLRLYVSGNNIFDKAYVNHLNRLKYEGILNQGRNIAFGISMRFSSGK